MGLALRKIPIAFDEKGFVVPEAACVCFLDFRLICYGVAGTRLVTAESSPILPVPALLPSAEVW
jgi:hypothetical protein